MMGRKVVITGLGLATALGLEVEENWCKALSATSGVSGIKLPGAEKSPVQAAGHVSCEDWDRICRQFPAEAECEGERRTLFALWASMKALADSGFDVQNPPCPPLEKGGTSMSAVDPTLQKGTSMSMEYPPLEKGTSICAEHPPFLKGGRGDFAVRASRLGVVLASGLGINRLEDIHDWLDADKKFDYAGFAAQCTRVHRESIIRNNASRPAALISDKFGFHGLNATVTTACASATQALGTAYRAIARGEADLMLAGGADSMLNPVGLIFFVLLGSAAVSKMDPQALCRPFDRRRSGLVMGEGAGMAVLEEESHALARGARIYGEVAGYATSMDAYRLTAPHPEGNGAETSMKRALADAGIGPDGIDYINAHGTSTKLNDLAETIAIKKVFGQRAPEIAISSSKSLIGHLLAGSGGPEFVFTALSVLRDEIHPTINLTNPDPKCDLDYVPGVKRLRTVRAALSNSFGFGGQNATIVIKKYTGGN